MSGRSRASIAARREGLISEVGSIFVIFGVLKRKVNGRGY